MNDYPNITPDTEDNRTELLRIITRERTNDISEANNYKNVFMRGRRVGRIPSSSSDVLDTDKINDFNIIDDGGSVYYYTLVLVGSTPTWGRIDVNTSW